MDEFSLFCKLCISKKSLALHQLFVYCMQMGIGSLFDPCVNAVGQRPYLLPHMEVRPGDDFFVLFFLFFSFFV